MDSDGLVVSNAFSQFKGKNQMNMDWKMISLSNIFWNQSESNEIHMESYIYIIFSSIDISSESVYKYQI